MFVLIVSVCVVCSQGLPEGNYLALLEHSRCDGPMQNAAVYLQINISFLLVTVFVIVLANCCF